MRSEEIPSVRIYFLCDRRKWRLMKSLFIESRRLRFSPCIGIDWMHCTCHLSSAYHVIYFQFSGRSKKLQIRTSAYGILKMHNTGKIREMSYVRHLTAYHIPSPLPKFKLCKTSMQVAPANLSVYYVNNGSHWYPEVSQESFILDCKFKFSGLRIVKVSNITSPT